MLKSELASLIFEDILASASYDNNVKLSQEEDDDWVSTATSYPRSTVWSISWEKSGERLASCSPEGVLHSQKSGNASSWKQGGDTNTGKRSAWRCEYTTIAGIHARSVYDLDWGSRGTWPPWAGRCQQVQGNEGDWVCELTEYNSHRDGRQLDTMENPKEDDVLSTGSDDGTIHIWNLSEIDDTSL